MTSSATFTTALNDAFDSHELAKNRFRPGLCGGRFLLKVAISSLNALGSLFVIKDSPILGSYMLQDTKGIFRLDCSYLERGTPLRFLAFDSSMAHPGALFQRPRRL